MERNQFLFVCICSYVYFVYPYWQCVLTVYVSDDSKPIVIFFLSLKFELLYWGHSLNYVTLFVNFFISLLRLSQLVTCYTAPLRKFNPPLMCITSKVTCSVKINFVRVHYQHVISLTVRFHELLRMKFNFTQYFTRHAH